LWPEDYIDWGRQTKPKLTSDIRELLSRLARQSLVGNAVADLADEAVRRAFAIIDSWRRYDGLIGDAVQFRRLLLALGMAEGLRLFLNHEYVASRVQQLGLERCRAVLLRYAAGLSPGDVAPVLGISTEEIRRAVLEGLDALSNLL
jgi:hypothetical protein